MHRMFRKALDEATGESEFVIVVFIDIRGFSPFSQRCESPDTAMFIKRVYMRLIDEYFNFASFYKSTGDGLLLTIPFDEKNLEEICQRVIASCIAIHSEFANICSGDPMITYEVPDKIGIGVARGTACCLKSGETIIDYSGRLLNLASRLTGLARPSGIIIDGKFGINLLSKEQRSNFEEANVYLDGVAESEPIQVYLTKEFTTIPKHNRQPIATKRWQEVTYSWSYRRLLKVRPFRFYLPSEALSPDDVEVVVTHNAISNGKTIRGSETIFSFQGFEYLLDRGSPCVRVDIPALCKRLAPKQLRENMKVTVTVAYVEK
jgi:class 3 adenylate cyclase